MTEEELANIEEGVAEVSKLVRAMGDMATEIRRLRALPVIQTCGDCADLQPDEGGWACSKTADEAKHGRWDMGAHIGDHNEPPPPWCPKRSKSADL